jgi:hypothetical protein
LKKLLFAWAASQEPGHVCLFSYDWIHTSMPFLNIFCHR